MSEPKLKVGDRVILPSGQEATVEEVGIGHQKNPNGGWDEVPEYHVWYPEEGLGGRLNFKESELRVWAWDGGPGHTMTPKHL